MARHLDPGNEVVYRTAARWIDDCLDSDGSLFVPGRPIWTLANLDDLFDRVWINEDTTPGGSFIEKLKSQLSGADPGVIQLAAEVCAVHFLSVWPGAVAEKTKLKVVQDILGWLPGTPPPLPEDVRAAFGHGIAHPGRYAMQYRYTQLSYLVHLAKSWKSEPPEKRTVMRIDPWEFETWARDTVEDRRWLNQYEMVLHLFHPATFEPIVNPDHKRFIAERFSDLAGDETDINRQVLAIRTALTPVEGDDFDWYDEPRVNRWWKSTPSWPRLCEWVEAVRGLPNFESDERDYKLEAIEAIQSARSSILADESGWSESLKRGFQNRHNNITNWQAHDTFLKWVAANPERARAALEALWIGEGNEIDRLSSFLELTPEDAIATPGNRLNIASYLLMAEAPKDRPPYRPSAIKKAWELAHWKIPQSRPEGLVYQTFLLLCDEIRHACPGIRDRLDAQGALWAITKGLATKPPSWSDETWAAFLQFRGDTDTAPAMDLDDVDEPPVLDPISEAANLLHLDRSVLDGIISLLEDKRQVILYGPPGTGKTFLAKTLAGALAGRHPQRTTIVQFHPAMSYEDFVQGYRPEQTEAGHVTYTLRDGHLLRMAKAAAAEPEKQFVMVIDEINRANLPKVLGELLFLLEYRGEAVPMLYEPETQFRLPENLWFIGTMNTADRSIALIDAALRRRFHFVPFFPTQPPMDKVLDRFLSDLGFSPIAGNFLQAVNNDLLTKQNVDEHVLIGPSHFMNPANYVDGELPEDVIERIWTYNVFPLIEELLWGQRSEIDDWRWSSVRLRYGSVLGIGAPTTGSVEPGTEQPPPSA